MTSLLAPQHAFDLTGESAKPDIRSARYVDCTDHLQCPVCKQPFVNPMTTICGHTFCQDCIEECLKMSKSPSKEEGFCPLDRTPLSRHNIHDIFPTPLLIANMVDELTVYCLNDERGCEWTGRRWELESHVTHDCGYTGVVCNGKVPYESPDTELKATDVLDRDANTRCGKIVERRYVLDTSEDTCVHERFPCRYCSFPIDKVTEEHHLNTICDANYTTCDLCDNDLIPKKGLEKHKANCKKTGVLVCPARAIGCDWVGHNEPSLENHTSKGNCALFQLLPHFKLLETSLDRLGSENTYLRNLMNKVLDSIVLGRVTNLGYCEPIEEIGGFYDSSQPEDTREAWLKLRCDFEKHRLEVEEKFIPFMEREKNAIPDREAMISSLVNENFVMKDELNLQRSLVNSLRKQVQFLLFQRRPQPHFFESEEPYLDHSSRTSSEERLNLKL